MVRWGCFANFDYRWLSLACVRHLGRYGPVIPCQRFTLTQALCEHSVNAVGRALAGATHRKLPWGDVIQPHPFDHHQVGIFMKADGSSQGRAYRQKEPASHTDNLDKAYTRDIRVKEGSCASESK